MPFTVVSAGEDVPALLWLPERPQRRRPLVLLGHGGGMHKESPLIDRLGSWLAGGHGIACLAIDLPFHGDRTPADEIGLSALERRHLLGLDGWRERNAGATGQAVADWRAAMDGAQDRDRMPHGPIGYFGVSMGTRFGVPLIAAEPRIAVAVLGLFGVPAADTESAFARAAVSSDGASAPPTAAAATAAGTRAARSRCPGVRYYVRRVPSPGLRP